MLYLVRRLCWQFQCWHWSIWVGVMYTEVIRVLLGPEGIRVSKKGMEPLSLGVCYELIMLVN